MPEICRIFIAINHVVGIEQSEIGHKRHRGVGDTRSIRRTNLRQSEGNGFGFVCAKIPQKEREGWYTRYEQMERMGWIFVTWSSIRRYRSTTGDAHR